MLPGFGWLWVAVGGFGSFIILVCTTNSFSASFLYGFVNKQGSAFSIDGLDTESKILCDPRDTFGMYTY